MEFLANKSRWSRTRARRWPAALVLLLILQACEVWSEVTREYNVKAVFLYNFAQFTDWPREAFASEDSPLVIGVLGTNPFDDFLAETVRTETAHGRKFEVKQFRTVAEIKTCHILYISDSEAGRLGRILEALKGRPILTVTDIDGAARRGVMIQFVIVHSKIRFLINNEAAKAANLTLSAKLLRVAEPPPEPR